MRPQLRSRFRIAQPEDTSPPPMATPARTKSSAPDEQGLVLHAIALLVAGLMLRWGESETLLWCGGLLWETGGRLLGSCRPDYTSGERTVPTFFARFHVSRFPDFHVWATRPRSTANRHKGLGKITGRFLRSTYLNHAPTKDGFSLVLYSCRSCVLRVRHSGFGHFVDRQKSPFHHRANSFCIEICW